MSVCKLLNIEFKFMWDINSLFKLETRRHKREIWTFKNFRGVTVYKDAVFSHSVFKTLIFAVKLSCKFLRSINSNEHL